MQIATPFSTGTGFVLSAQGFVVTNEHVVRDNKAVIVQSHDKIKQMCNVVFIDQKYDLALLKWNGTDDIPHVEFSAHFNLGENVIAIGHPLGLQYSVTKGIISSLEYDQSGISYIQHDAALSPGNSGGPLLNENGQLLGINSFIVKNGINIGLSLPAKHLKNILDFMVDNDNPIACRCFSCESIIIESDALKHCTTCGDTLETIGAIQEYLPIGMNKKIEDLLTCINVDPAICRKGPHSWEVNHGSARINISYHEKSGYIVLDAVLAKLTKENIEELYRYLLQQNYYNQGITFSLKNDNIILSVIIYDQYLNLEVANKIFSKLFKAADMYDDILVNRFGATWI